ncbi:MAG TPA: hypothetical protein ENO23_01755 [Alphaproteobacteria bacterium]|nr:hypothetical protein [Alphaproteobacteria bacterium]
MKIDGGASPSGAALAGQVGSLGEFIAAIATLVTLVYLALQLRSNTHVNHYDAYLKARQLTAEAAKLTAEPDEARVFGIGLGDADALTEDERASLHGILHILVNPIDARLEYRRVTGDPDAYEPVDDPLEALAVRARLPAVMGALFEILRGRDERACERVHSGF